MQPTIPGYLTSVVLVVPLVLAGWLYRVIAKATRQAVLPATTRARFRLSTGVFLAGWLGLAFLTAPSSPVLNEAGEGVVPASFLFFGGVSLTLAIGLLAFSPSWRKIVQAVPADRLISTQVYRLIGILFLQLYALGSLPGYFALPAGLGDLAVGLMAPVIAWLVHRSLRAGRSEPTGVRVLTLGWNLFGFLDLLIAVGMGTGFLLRLTRPELGVVPPVQAMTAFPLVLIPTYAVPLGFILHIYSIWRTVRSRKHEPAELGEITSSPLETASARA